MVELKNKFFLVLFYFCSLILGIMLISIFLPIASMFLGRGFLMYLILSIFIITVSFVTSVGFNYFELRKGILFILLFSLSILISVASGSFIYVMQGFLEKLSSNLSDGPAGSLGSMNFVSIFDFGSLNVWIFVILILIFYNLPSLISLMKKSE